MAEPIPLDLPTRDPRAELLAKLQNAPTDHAEAMLAAYEVLQGLHDRGVLEIVRGALGSADDLIQIGVAAAKSPEAIRGIRNAIVLVKVLGEVDPDALKVFTQAAPKALAAAAQPTRPKSLFALLRGFSSPASRRGLAAVHAMLETLGETLPDLPQRPPSS